MILAHSSGANGPEIEMLLTAVALLVLGIIFFVQKSAPPSVSIAMLVGALLLGFGSFALDGGGAGGHDDSGPNHVSVTIASPEDGATVPARKPVVVDSIVKGASLGAGVAHLHILVDGETVSMSTTEAGKVDLAPGEHTIAVELTRANHDPFDPRVVDEVTVVAE